MAGLRALRAATAALVVLRDRLDWRGEALDRLDHPIATGLGRLDGHQPPPSLVHGDLWSGNRLRTTRGPAIVDPACSDADRETELAMMALFGGFSPRAWAAYDRAWPLEPGWQQRVTFYVLFHLLNHEVIFGGYRSAVLAQADHVLRGAVDPRVPQHLP